jgi:choline dehydrogenase
VLPYFQRSEHQERGASDLHGIGGPLHVADPAEPNPLSEAFVAAGEELGWPRNDDFNGPRQTGVGLYQATVKDGRRCSAAAAYLTPALERPNLTVATGARATRVLFEGRRAAGVELKTFWGRRRVRAEGEVILAAGTVGSPQLLLLSGVGPADAARRLGLPVVADLPGVGRNLQDHVLVPVVCRTREDVGLDHAETLGNLIRYLRRKEGPYRSNLCEAGAFVRTVPDRDLPDLQFHFLPTAITDHGFGEPTDQGFNFGPTLLRPKSVGEITLRSADPKAPPRIRANYLDDPADLEVLVEGIRLSRQLAATDALSSYVDFEVLPGADAETDDEVAAFVRRSAQTLYHPVGTCRMGPESQLSGERPPVVDAELRVHGFEGLRVVDASIMPEILGGNTNAPSMMIAEKAAELIRGR